MMMISALARDLAVICCTSVFFPVFLVYVCSLLAYIEFVFILYTS